MYILIWLKYYLQSLDTGFSVTMLFYYPHERTADQLTPWRRAILDKRIFAELVKKYFALY
jgi:hypothetical protein